MAVVFSDAGQGPDPDGIESDRLHVFVGRDARMMNVATRVAPRQAIHLIQRQMKDLLGR